VNGSVNRSIAAVGVAFAMCLVLLGLAVAVFFNPWFVAFEQDRSNAAAYTGYSPQQLHTVTDAILGDLYLGAGNFDVQANGAPVLDPREQQHMRDVKGVFTGFWLLVALGALTLAVTHRASRGSAWYWRSVAAGASALGIAVVGLGLVAAVAFDILFEVFHRLFFGAGSYTFDPRTERLVQLFPDAFWFETSMLLAAVLVTLAIGVRLIARHRVGGSGTGFSGPTAVPVEHAR
jgi:integral membrane protein (TIGR01906 family)